MQFNTLLPMILLLIENILLEYKRFMCGVLLGWAMYELCTFNTEW